MLNISIFNTYESTAVKYVTCYHKTTFPKTELIAEYWIDCELRWDRRCERSWHLSKRF